MVFYLLSSPLDYAGTMKDIVYNLFNQEEIILTEETPLLEKEKSYFLRARIEQSPSGIGINLDMHSWQGEKWDYHHWDREIVDSRYEGTDWPRRAKEALRLGILKLMTKVFSLPPRPWGILLGVRPTKVVHRLLDKGFTSQEILSKLPENYGLNQAKSQLITKVAQIQKPFLLSSQEAKKKIAVYVGIPFCPTRCLYCSFPSYSLARDRNYLDSFLEALLKEIEMLGSFIGDNKLEVESLYLGGGTPTSFNASQLEILLNKLGRYFPANNLKEYTVEAGRPDTIDREKLQLMKQVGVTRLSINPQTMNDSTLQTIGRGHSAKDVYQSFFQAREEGFSLINMDIILGLPGEGIKEVTNTMEQIKELQPENLTCHTMALKRASLLKEKLGSLPLTSEGDVEEMLDLVNRYTEDLGLIPYYLYRQRYILGNLENIGYSLPGQECIYNIQMMEERQTVIALGGGGVSKIIYPPHWKVERFFNPKDPKTYIDQIQELSEKKLDLLGLWLTSLRE